jgi:hypothetical protein
LCSRRPADEPDEHAVRAAHVALHLGDHVLRRRVGRQFGTQALGQRQLVVGNVDRDDVKAHRLGVLHRHGPEPADARDGDPVAKAVFAVAAGGVQPGHADAGRPPSGT